MTNSYRAIRVVMGDETATNADGAEMADALTALAEAGGVTSIAEPISWQKQQREDRHLPGYDAAR